MCSTFLDKALLREGVVDEEAVGQRRVACFAIYHKIVPFEGWIPQ
jgi:hypothetical protein